MADVDEMFYEGVPTFLDSPYRTPSIEDSHHYSELTEVLGTGQKHIRVFNQPPYSGSRSPGE